MWCYSRSFPFIRGQGWGNGFAVRHARLKLAAERGPEGGLGDPLDPGGLAAEAEANIVAVAEIGSDVGGWRRLQKKTEKDRAANKRK